ncbi:4Fe-4S binding protein [bacterium]|nr:4Fe-4S binding protein [bacterium]
MSNTVLADLIREKLTSAGASVVGFADISVLEPDARYSLPVGICIGVALDPGIVTRIQNGPTREYGAEYDKTNAFLDKLGSLCAQILRSYDSKSIVITSENARFDKSTLSAALPNKTVATRAGIGWIGKCALLVTKEFGSAVRLKTVLTDADLPAGNPIDESRCGSCRACVDVCPGRALTGKNWSAGAARSDIYDAFACYKAAKSLSDAQGITHSICGMCINACPWTKKYLSRSKWSSIHRRVR